MQKFFVPRSLFAIALLGIVLMVVACGGDTPTSTPVPPTVNVPTGLPPAPTAPPLTAPPTAVLPTATPPPPAATAVVPPTEAPTTKAPPTATNTSAPSSGAAATTPTTASAGAAASPTTSSAGAVANPTRQSTASAPAGANVDRGALNGLYISKLRFEPDYPVNNDPVRFYATIINQTGKDQHYPVCVEIYRPGAAKPFGTSSCDTSTIVPNTGEVFAGYWTGTGIKECIPVRARPILREEGEGETRLVFTTPAGAELWIDFNVCP